MRRILFAASFALLGVAVTLVFQEVAFVPPAPNGVRVVELTPDLFELMDVKSLKISISDDGVRLSDPTSDFRVVELTPTELAKPVEAGETEVQHQR